MLARCCLIQELQFCQGRAYSVAIDSDLGVDKVGSFAIGIDLHGDLARAITTTFVTQVVSSVSSGNKIGCSFSEESFKLTR